jgi:DNA-nicking Smr family endonuclease
VNQHRRRRRRPPSPAVAAQPGPDPEFRSAVADARPLALERRVTTKPHKPPASARFTAAARREMLAESLALDPEAMDAEIGDTVSFKRPGVQDNVLRKLRRGQYRIESELDLHGMNLEAARGELRAFLMEARLRQLRALRIVHGKGLRSGHRGPVVKVMTLSLLRRFDAVLAFCSARHVDGGTGAVYVLLTA